METEIKKYSEMSSVNDQTVMITTKIDKAPFFLKKGFPHWIFHTFTCYPVCDFYYNAETKTVLNNLLSSFVPWYGDWR